MLSYRHAFHAGNFADVLKHSILLHSLHYLAKKDKPFCYIDTHAGAGSTALNSDYALKNKEFNNGIGALWQRHDLPEAIADYVAFMKTFNHGDALNRYAGSPLIAQQLMRRQDHLFLYELHSTEIKLLKTAVAKDRRITVFHQDGLKHAIGLLPPLERRGLVLIDPSYEVKTDYEQVLETLVKMVQRFATGTYALWYPVVERARNVALEQAIIATGIKNVQLFELGIKADSAEHGMTASGMIVVNPPWTLAPQMQLSLPWLASVLGQDGEGSYRIATLVAE